MTLWGTNQAPGTLVGIHYACAHTHRRTSIHTYTRAHIHTLTHPVRDMVGQVNSTARARGSACRASLHLFMEACQLPVIHHSTHFLCCAVHVFVCVCFTFNPSIRWVSPFLFSLMNGCEVLVCEGQNSAVVLARKPPLRAQEAWTV